MAVRYHASAGVFTLQTEKSTYQMKVDSHGVLLHTYFGAAADETDFSYLIVPADHGFCGQPGDVPEDRAYSLDYLPQEYPVHGNGDYRIKALRAGWSGEVPCLDLRYVSHRIYSGKYNLEGLPALFAGEEDTDAETLEITLKDLYEEIYVTLLYGVFEKKGVIARSAQVENRGKKTLNLRRVMSAAVDFPAEVDEMLHFYGKHAGERQLERKSLPHGITEISSVRGTSSHQQNPFVILCGKDTTEEFGDCYGISLLYSGGFRMQAERDQFDHTRFVCGLQDEEFFWMLAPGERFVAPEAVLAYSGQGFSELSDCMGQIFYTNLIRSSWKEKQRPILVNNWEATYFDFHADKLLEIAGEAAKLGLDMLVLDDGWFGKRDDDNSGLGDWRANEKKLGCSLKELADQVNDLGLKFGIWAEFEMVSEDSDLYRQHPDWAFRVPGRVPNRGRNQLVLDLSRKEVREYLKRSIDRLMSSANIAYVKWDMNRSIDCVCGLEASSASQGALAHKYVLGLYEVLEYLVSRYPDVLLEGCAGGGGRFDAGMLYYAPQSWCSDNTDAIERLRIQYGTSFGYPMSAVSAHVSVCPNHQNGRVTPFRTRGICAMQGAFGYELDLSALNEKERKEVKQQTAWYRKYCRLFQTGRYYRLTSPFENRDFTAWSYVARNQSQAVLGVVYTDLHGNPEPYRLKLKGLSEKRRYLLEGREYTGTALMRGGIVLPVPKENYDSYMVCIEECK